MGSIEHDAFVFNLALMHRVTGQRVRAHGHSRGGAVILEAARQNPALFRDVEVILEAPVLPGGQGHPAGAGLLGAGPLPVADHLHAAAPDRRRTLRRIRLRPLTPRKVELVRGLYFSPKTFRIVLENLISMRQWIAGHDRSIFANILNGTILVGASDRVLDRPSMLRSARTAGSGWRVVETRGTSHFVSLDQPDTVPALSAL